jgi:hypothetical protein
MGSEFKRAHECRELSVECPQKYFFLSSIPISVTLQAPEYESTKNCWNNTKIASLKWITLDSFQFPGRDDFNWDA